MNKALKLIINADVYAPERLGIRHILVAGERIVAILEQAPNIDDRLDVDLVDLQGLRLMPGLIDGHAHITGGGGESGPESRVPPVPISNFTSAGVTTVVGLLGTDDLTRNTKTLLTQARGLQAEGMTAYCYAGGYHLPPQTVTGSVRGDIVFIDQIIGVGELAISDHRSSQPTLNELLRVASEAHVAGVMTGKAGIVHLHLGDGERGLQLVREAMEHSEIPARVFNPTHVNRKKQLFDEACELTKLGCCIDVTAFPADDNSWSAADSIRLYLERDLPPANLTVSSDGGGCLPDFDADGECISMSIGSASTLPATLAELLSESYSLDALAPFFTANAAMLLRLRNKGRVDVDKDADLLVLDDKHQVHSVMARGHWHVLDGQQQVLGMFEERH
ncbi:MAG: beta-aspartyl-peptidase [Pseudomonadota bacterium]